MTGDTLRGALAGAAGTTALNAAGYLDMAWRGRPASDGPQDLAEQAAQRAGVPIRGDKDKRRNRLQGLGGLSGIGVGVAVGAAAGLIGGAWPAAAARCPPPPS